MRRLNLSSLKARLYLLVLVTVVPFWALILYNATEQRSAELKKIEHSVLELAEIVAADEAQLIEGARQILVAMGHFVIATNANPTACSEFCESLREHFVRYANLGAILLDGTVFCSAAPSPPSVNALDQDWFQDALASNDLAIGSFHIGRITQKPVMVMAQSVLGVRGEPVAVMFAAIDIRWLNRLTDRLTSRLPKGATLSQIDADGVLLSYRMDTHSWQAGSMMDPLLIHSMILNKRGIVEAPDNQGNSRIHSFAPLRSALKDRDVEMVLSIPQDVVFADSKRMLIHNLTLLVAVCIVALILARYAGDYFVLRPVAALVEASRKLATGDLTTRIGPQYGEGELGQLAGAFDEMAEALETHEREQKINEERLRQSREQLRNLTVYIQTVREEERTRIARDIHDNLGQALTALKMDVSWLEKKLSEENPLMLNKTKSMNGLIEETIQTVQRISAELRPGLLDDFGLIAAIEWQIEEFEERTGIKATLHLPEHAIDIGKDQSTAIFRIFQEALTNVIRHANASAIEVTLEENDGRLSLIVRDNGRGITTEETTHPKSFGLIGMQERVYPWGGEVRIRGISDRGTTVTVTIPLTGKEKHHD